MVDEKDLAKDMYSQRIFRIKEEYITFCEYLDFHAKKHNIDRNMFYDNLFKYSLDHIIKFGFNYSIDEYLPRRRPKGFPLLEETSLEFSKTFKFYKDIFFKKFNRSLLVCEYVELLIYIYANNKLEQKEKDINNIEWGITEIKD